MVAQWGMLDFGTAMDSITSTTVQVFVEKKLFRPISSLTTRDQQSALTCNCLAMQDVVVSAVFETVFLTPYCKPGCHFYTFYTPLFCT